MSSNTPFEPASEPDASPQSATMRSGQRTRSVQPVIDLEAEPAQRSASETKSATHLHLKALGLGALAGAIAGAITVVLAYTLLARSPDDLTKRQDEISKRISALESQQTMTPEQGAALDQKITALAQKNDSATQKNLLLEPKLVELERTISSLKETVTAQAQNRSDEQTRADLSALSTRLDGLTLALETLRTNSTHAQNQMIARVAGGLSLALTLRTKMIGGLSFERDLAALDALQIDGISLTPLRAALDDERTATKNETLPSEIPLANDIASKFLALLSRLVTISPADKTADTSKSRGQNGPLTAVDHLINDLTTRLVEESAQP